MTTSRRYVRDSGNWHVVANAAARVLETHGQGDGSQGADTAHYMEEVGEALLLSVNYSL